MEPFARFNAILDRLLGPDGCPWDRKQTLLSLRTDVLEEVCELIEAIDLNDNQHIKEELGDLFLNALFFCKVAEKEGRFTTDSVLQELCDKLVRRHPHVFAEAKVENMEAHLEQWERIKGSEAHKQHRTSALDGIPKDLPALARAQKSLKRMQRASYNPLPQPLNSPYADEESLGETLFNLVSGAEKEGLNAEQALRSYLARLERDFRHWEKVTKAP